MNVLAETLARSPELFPHALDLRTDSVAFLHLSEADYRAASFLDERLLGPQTGRRIVPFRQVKEAVHALSMQEKSHFIFHIGHVGSTLVSRLLGAQKGAFCLREPAILRTLAMAPKATEERLDPFLKLYGRTFRVSDQAIVKATSFVSELAPAILVRPSRPNAVLISVAPASYLATILGGANAPSEAKALAPSRHARLAAKLGQPLAPVHTFGLGETVALAWASEMCALLSARGVAGDRVIFLDFDAFLANPAPALARMLGHFGVPVSLPDIDATLASPLFRQYAKAPEYAYDAALRREVQDDARRQFPEEIARGLNWLGRMANAHPMIGEAIAITGK